MIFLKWKDVWDSETTFEKTVRWYKHFYKNKESFSLIDLQNYIDDAKAKKLCWSQ